MGGRSESKSKSVKQDCIESWHGSSLSVERGLVMLNKPGLSGSGGGGGSQLLLPWIGPPDGQLQKHALQ